jgi:hypothetical protein
MHGDPTFAEERCRHSDEEGEGAHASRQGPLQGKAA